MALAVDIRSLWPCPESPDAKTVNDELIRALIEETQSRRPRLWTIEDPVEIACEVFQVPASELASPSRARSMGTCRATCAVIVRAYPYISLNVLHEHSWSIDRGGACA